MDSLCSALKIISIEIHPVTSKLLLPVGISFYTFQTLAYVIDVYREDIKAEKHLGYYATFISFFPQLVAGPIERASNFLPQIKKEKKFDYDFAMYGAYQILWGFFKKLAIADVVGWYVDKVYNNLNVCTGFDLACAVFLFSIQIYSDFSGYSDIAIGTAKLFGCELTTNFLSPYFACSIKEFWGRWHISLSQWFRDYVYIPLGGNRCSKRRKAFNLLITFLASGIWHGANWSFVIWGAIHGLGQIIEKIFGFTPKQKIGKIAAWFSVFVFCNIAWVFFRANNLRDAIYILAQLIINISHPISYTYSGVGVGKFRLLFMVFVISIIFLHDFCMLKEDVIAKIREKGLVIKIALGYMLIVMMAIGLLYSSGNNQFVYFQF